MCREGRKFGMNKGKEGMNNRTTKETSKLMKDGVEEEKDVSPRG